MIARLYLALLLLAGATPLRAATIAHNEEAGITIGVSPVFGNLPTFGAAPFRVEIENRSTSPGEWELRWSSSQRSGRSVETRQTYRVEAGQKRVFIANPSLLGKEGGRLEVNASGSGIVGGRNNFSHNSEGNGTDTPMLAFGPDIAARSLEPLRNRANKNSESGQRKGESFTLHATTFVLEDLPDQWVSYTGIEWLFLSEAEWARLPAGVRNALRQWVGSGGNLVVAARQPGEVVWLKGAAQGVETYGSGTFRAIQWDGVEISPSSSILTLVGRETRARRDHIAAEWPGLPRLANLAPPRTLIVISGLVLAGIFGPLNLLLLAPSRRRHRLFITTPLLALGSSAILVAGIFLVDGTGGRGGRVTVWNLLPGTPEAVVHQAQMTRSGFLFSSAFTLEEPATVRHLTVEREHRGRLIPPNADGVCRIEGAAYSGSWFRSRSVQALELAALRPTREGISLLKEPEGLHALSRFGQPLEEVYLSDGQGGFWRAERLPTGERTVLEPMTREGFTATWRRIKETFPPALRNSAMGPDAMAPSYFARVGGSSGALETLPSIRWDKQETWAVGPLEHPTP